MNVEQAYNQWANQYDSNANKTRDAEGLALPQVLGDKIFNRTLENGCGTGKNTVWLQTVSNEVVAVDLSPAMLEKARNKICSEQVQFHQGKHSGGLDFCHRRL